MRYSVVGLGKLGACMAAAIADRGHPVVGVDVSGAVVDRVNRGEAPVAEPGLAELLRQNRERLRATADPRAAVLDSDVSFVVVPTPSDARGAFTLAHAARAFAAIGRALAEKEAYHLVVLTSTVLPGATRHGLLPILESASGKRCGRDFGLCYSPEFIALGSVVRDFLNPDFTLVGEHEARSGDLLEAAYGEILENGAPCRRMSLENAELAKLALNTYVTTKIAFANTLAELCERLPGGDVDAVTDTLGLDRRIGRAYLTGALGYGGPCFPRDNAALAFLARSLGAPAALAEATDASNRGLAERAARRVQELAAPGSTVAVLGLAYKPGTDVVEESQGLELARALAGSGMRVRAHDPLAAAAARSELEGEVEVLDSVDECLAEADVVLVTLPDPAYRALRADDFGDGLRRITVVDFWRILDGELRDRPHVRYVPYGRDPGSAAAAAALAALWSEGPEEGASSRASGRPIAATDGARRPVVAGD